MHWRDGMPGSSTLYLVPAGDAAGLVVHTALRILLRRVLSTTGLEEVQKKYVSSKVSKTQAEHLKHKKP